MNYEQSRLLQDAKEDAAMAMTNEELRVACAEAMGWKWVEPNGIDPYWRFEADRKKDRHRDDLPNFPTDANAALTLCDALADQGWDWTVTYREQQLTVWFGMKYAPHKTVTATGPTLPIAICRAYLAVIQSQTPTT